MPAQDRKAKFDAAIAKHEQAMDKRRAVVKSFYRVRQALGWLGFMLPVLLMVSGMLARTGVEPSISDFFHTVSRDIFVGIMFSIGTFLIVYEGYDRQPDETIADNWLATIAGISVFGVALFPNESPTGEIASVVQQTVGVGLSPLFHYSCAFVFFYCMGHFCMFKFSKTSDKPRRKIYRGCGWAIIFSCAGLFFGSIAKKMGPPDVSAFIVDFDVIFWVEVVGVWAFSLAWLVKGRADQEMLAIAPTVPRQTG
ncbi:hypothetical protein [uncultured Litoreibacter sp.]|uniref:hypothetical protein n=1 Tax=uncultured Litoreibacter sp. TaxID=1392394 RepID=UPI00260DDD4A|nr:hypothetical protein [uncultured Litoreibacter sp.]